MLQYDHRLKVKAQDLRKNQTDTERFLWQKLRGKQILGYKFRRQHPVAGYILDFYCAEKKLAIELDGSQHMNSQYQKKDLERTKKLEGEGIIVLRFWDNDVFKNTDGVLEKIAEKLSDTSP